MNIEGLVGGYTGPGGKTILPHRAAAKLDLRLVPDMTYEDTVAKLKAHLQSRGYGDIEVNMTGGYDPTYDRRQFAHHPGTDSRVSKRGDRSDHVAAARRARGRATCSPAHRSISRRLTTVLDTARGPTRRMSTT